MEVGNRRDLIETDLTDQETYLPETHQPAGQLQVSATHRSATTNIFNELQQEHEAAARKSLRLPYLSESQQGDLAVTSPHSPSPLDLASLVELGLSSKALDYLTNRPPQLGIPKAIRLELELLTSKTHREQLSQTDILREPPPLVGRSLPCPPQPERRTTYANSQLNAPPGYT
jgi:hypothetical protein